MLVVVGKHLSLMNSLGEALAAVQGLGVVEILGEEDSLGHLEMTQAVTLVGTLAPNHHVQK